ncbi:MAG: ORF6N domain-containing protein [Nitrospiraceae bacterium]
MQRERAKFVENFTIRFMRDEAGALSPSRSPSLMLKWGQNIKHLPYVFTEHGAIMAANVLNSPHAVQRSVFLVSAFVPLRHMITTHKQLAAKLAELERTVVAHDGHIKALFEAIRELMTPRTVPSRRIGF